MMRKLTRREFIAGTVIIASAGSLTGIYLTHKADVSSKKSATNNQKAANVINEPVDDISEIGKIYLEVNKLSNDSETRKMLLNQLLGVDDIERFQSIFSSFRLQINKKIQEDIKQQKWCIIDGWQLTETECMVSAIAFIEMRSEIGIEKDILNKPKYQNIPFDLPEGNISEITAWGPQTTSQGQAFNPQPNGNSALWIKTADLTGANYVVFFGKYPTHSTVHASGLITADLLPAEAIEATQATGTTPVFLVDSRKKIKQKIGMFTITKGQVEVISKQYLHCYEQAKIGDLAEVLAWGPVMTEIGQDFNIQPDKSSAFWIKLKKAKNADYTVALGDVILTTKNHDKGDHELLTANVEDYVTAALVHKAQQIPLYIIAENKKQMVGFFRIE